MKRDFSLPGRSPVIASECAASTSHPLATATALAILRDGGNAVDAAIAAVATQCVVEPHMTGIGGDCFAIVGTPEGQLHGLNGSGRSPAGADLDWYLEKGFASIEELSPHSVTVPGAVKAWIALHEKFGSIELPRLFADAIRFAEHGYPVGSRVAADWAGQVDKLAGNPVASKYLLFDGKAPSAGDCCTLPSLGATLRAISVKGASAFYEGEVAAEIASTIQSLGGFLSEEDLAGVSADWVETISAEFQGHRLNEIPPNGQGLAALMLVQLLERIGLADEPDSLVRAHLEMECGRIAYTARDAYIGDPDFMSYSVDQLLSDEHIQALCGLYDPVKRNPEIHLPDPVGSDTVYLTVVDRNGMAVSLINSLFGGFGSGIMTEKSGIVLQNRACGFNLKPGHGNSIGPSKRPFHTIIPGMVTKDGKITHSFGVMGGQYQAMGQAHVLSNMLVYGMDPQQALDDPRIFWNDAGELDLETLIDADIEKGLQQMGHSTTRGAVHGGGQVIQIDHERGCLVAGSDPRKDGHAAGY